MSADERLDVMIAVYLFDDLARRDYDAIVDLAGTKAISLQGVILATKDAQGEMKVIESGDHLARKGATVFGGAGLVIGLFAPPLLAATALGAGAGALAGKFAKHRVESGIGDKLDDVLPEGSAALIAIYDHADADQVDGAVANAVRKSIAQIDGASAKELKEGLAEAQAGLIG